MMVVMMLISVGVGPTIHPPHPSIQPDDPSYHLKHTTGRTHARTYLKSTGKTANWVPGLKGPKPFSSWYVHPHTWHSKLPVSCVDRGGGGGGGGVAGSVGGPWAERAAATNRPTTQPTNHPSRTVVTKTSLARSASALIFFSQNSRSSAGRMDRSSGGCSGLLPGAAPAAAGASAAAPGGPCGPMAGRGWEVRRGVSHIDRSGGDGWRQE